MTFLALDSTESRSPGTKEDSVSAMKTNTTSGPRFSLRKRAANTDRPKTTLSTVNSAFLSGLFADVAKVQVDFDDFTPQDNSNEDSDPRSNQSLPSKKSRFSMSKSMSRCGKSMICLTDAIISPPSSPNNDKKVLSFSATHRSTEVERKDSLLFQLHCVSSTSSSESSTKPSSKTILDAAALEFPHLPATVSATSCNTLTHYQSDLQSSTVEKSQKECYGWFVEVDEEDESVPASTTAIEPRASTSTVELAFFPTAPKATKNYDAEVEWAKAADTVDDVLGDFF
jgi:hypothetical protein